jgi:threonine synthase
VVYRYMQNQKYEPSTTIPTLSNAMDVSDPSNFIRIQTLYKDFEHLKPQLTAYTFSDNQTQQAMQEVYSQWGYLMDPHGAIAYLGLEAYRKTTDASNFYGVFLETAHPAKFLEVITDTYGFTPPIPKALELLKDRPKIAHTCSKNYPDFIKTLHSIDLKTP